MTIHSYDSELRKGPVPMSRELTLDVGRGDGGGVLEMQHPPSKACMISGKNVAWRPKSGSMNGASNSIVLGNEYHIKPRRLWFSRFSPTHYYELRDTAGVQTSAENIDYI